MKKEINCPGEESPAHKLANMVIDAARLRSRVAGWMDDVSYREGHRILYSVDADVVKLYSNPELTGPPRYQARGRERAGYTQVFSSDPPRLAIALAEAVTRAIFFDSRYRFMVPPLDEELRSIVAALISTLQMMHRRATLERDQLKQILDALESIPNIEDQLLLLETQAPGIFDLLFGRTNAAIELLRLEQLRHNAGLPSLGEFLDAGHVLPARVRSALEPPGSDIGKWFELNQYAETYKKALEDASGLSIPSLSEEQGTSRQERLRGDVNALSRLAFATKRLEDTGWRLVHVTGAERVHNAMRLIPNHLNAEWPAPYVILRHPSAWLADPAIFFAAESASGTGMVEILDALLARFDDGSGNFHERLTFESSREMDRLKRRAAQVLVDDPEICDRVQKDWESLVSPLLLRHTISAVRSPDTIRLLSPSATSIAERLIAFRAEIGHRLDAAWSASFNVIAAAGLALAQTRALGNVVSREIPPLYFDRWPVATDALVRIEGGLAATDHASTGHTRTLDVLRSEDPTGYSSFVFFAMLFACEGKWHTAEVLSRQAIEVATNLAGNERQITGREAHYLRAVAQRMLAQDVVGLAVAERSLELAEKCLAQDQKGHPGLRLTNIRFCAERIAIETGRYMFEQLPMTNPSSSVDADVLLRRILRCVMDVNREPDNRIRVSVERRLIANFLSVFLIEDSRVTGNADALLEDAKSLSLRFVDLMRTHEPKYPVSFLHSAIRLVAIAVLHPPPTKNKRMDLRHDIEKLLQQAPTHRVKPYDDIRYDAMRRIGLRALTG
jgi:hypothetical protein